MSWLIMGLLLIVIEKKIQRSYDDIFSFHFLLTMMSGHDEQEIARTDVYFQESRLTRDRIFQRMIQITRDYSCFGEIVSLH